MALVSPPSWLLRLLVLLLALAGMNYPALVNGFPLLYSDSGTYIVAGFWDHPPLDRPAFYAHFVRHTSLWYSLWLVLLAQSLVVIYVMRLVMRYLLGLYHTFIPACLVLTGLGLLTGLAYNNSQVMADAFSPLMLLCGGILIAGKKITWGHRFWLMVIFMFSTIVHGSHLLVISAVAIVLLLVRMVYGNNAFFTERRKTQKRFIFWSLASWLIAASLNYSLGGGFTTSRGGNFFLTGRLLETGAAQLYLEKHCPDTTFELCSWRDSLPGDAVALLWDFGTSPIYRGGCAESPNGWGECWIEKEKEYGQLAKNILLYTPARNKFIRQSIADSWEQLHRFNLIYLDPMAEGSPIYPGIQSQFPRDMRMYKNSAQYSRTIDFKTESAIQRWVVYSSLLVLLVLIIINIRSRFGNTQMAFALMVIIACMINAAVCASLACVADRYMARIIWLVPLAAVLFAWRYIIYRKHLSTQQQSSD